MIFNKRKEKEFMALVDEYDKVIARVCSVYKSPSATFEDLYQEVLANLWAGLESFRGEAKLSTWIYRTAINTCITWHRKNFRHSGTLPLEHATFVATETPYNETEDIKLLYRLIARLSPIDKAVVTLWLDDKSYEDISLITGLSPQNVGTRLHRAKAKLSQLAKTEQ